MVPYTDKMMVPVVEDNDGKVGEFNEYISTLEWKIKWDIVSNLPHSMCVKSSVIKTEAHEWQLQLFPDGLTQLQEGFLSIYLTSLNVSTVQLSCCFSICNQLNEKVIPQEFTDHLFSGQGISWGFPEYVSREVVQGLLTKGQLTIHCEIKIKYIDSICTLTGSVECVSRSQELDRYENLLDNLMYSDVAFNVQGTLIYAHRVILAGNSQVFRDMLSDHHTQAIVVHDVSYEVFMEVLRFVYAAKVNGIKTLAEPLLKAAARFKLEKLMRMCEQTIVEEVGLHNAFFYLDIAYQCGASYLKKCIYKFIKTHKKKDIVEKPEYKHFISMHSGFLNELVW